MGMEEEKGISSIEGKTKEREREKNGGEEWNPTREAHSKITKRCRSKACTRIGEHHQ